jgi:hypothetical protein
VAVILAKLLPGSRRSRCYSVLGMRLKEMFALCGALAVVACSRPLSLQFPNTVLSMSIYNYKEGGAVTNCSIAPNSDQRRLLDQWLAENRTGWRISIVDWAPGILIRSEGSNLNFIGNAAIFNSSAGQFIHPASKEYDFLRCPPGPGKPESSH